MDDLISRQAAIDAVNRLSLGEADAVRLSMRIADYLNRMPPAQPEIIHCKECKYIKWEMLAPWFRVWLCDQHKMQVTPEFWCAYGEKKGERK